MNRRCFLNRLAMAALLPAVSPFEAGKKRVAITMDDPNSIETPLLSPYERNRAILDVLRESKLKAALFVCGMRVDDEAGRGLLEDWDKERHVIANHTYSHLYYHASDVGAEQFIEEIRRGEAIVRDFSQFRRRFRFPLLKEGNTREKRDRVRAFLSSRGYASGAVTIDTSDWYLDQRLRERAKDPDADLIPYRDFYLEHIWERTSYYEELAREVLGRTVRHTLLIHHNLLNALFLGDLLRMFRTKGWELVDAENAFEDEVFSAAPEILPAGESVIWGLAKETGRFEEVLRYPGEDGEYEKARMDELGL